MENSTFSNQSVESKLRDTRKTLENLKWRLSQFVELRKSETCTWESFEETLDMMAEVKSGTREIAQKVIDRKKQADFKRKNTDDINLTLQSFLYEKNHY